VSTTQPEGSKGKKKKDSARVEGSVSTKIRNFTMFNDAMPFVISCNA